MMKSVRKLDKPLQLLSFSIYFDFVFLFVELKREQIEEVITKIVRFIAFNDK